jgi:protein-disulfide isomerase
MTNQFSKNSGFKKTNIWQILTFLLIGLTLGFLFGRYELSKIPADSQLKVNLLNENKNAKNVNPLKVSDDDDPSLGDANAPTTLINFCDYQSPFCKKFYYENFHKLKEEYIDTGKIRYVYRDFPLYINKKSVAAAKAAECADEQNNYWAMHNLLYERQTEWIESENHSELFAEYSKEININSEMFISCMESLHLINEIDNDKKEGMSYGVSSLPGLFVNGKMLKGIPKDYSNLKKHL